MAMKPIGINDPSVRISIGLGVAGVIITGLIVYMLIMPRIADTKAVAEDLKGRQQELNKIRNNENKLPTLQANVEKLQLELDSLEKSFPDKVDLPGLISMMTKIARNEGLLITMFKPNAAVTKEYYVENSYSLTVIGPYHKIGSFFARIANFDLIVNISNMKLTTSGAVTKELSEYLANNPEIQEYNNSISSTKADFNITTYSSLPGQ